MHHRSRQTLKRLLLSTFTGLFLFMQTAQAANYITFIHTDVLGSPVAITDQNGNIVSREHVSPYGDSLGKRSDDDSNPIRSSEHGIGYTGHVKDKDLGLTYMQARYYDPTIGRFMSTDPVGFRATNPALFNRYAYANNNPYKYVDPDGRLACGGACIFGVGVTVYRLSVVATGIIGAYIGAAIQQDVVQPMLDEEADVHEEEVDVRGKPGADGGISEITEGTVDDETVSIKHKVTVDGEVVHEHIDHKGKYGSSRRFSDELTGETTVDDGSHEPDAKGHDINHGSSQQERENPGPPGEF